MRPPAPLVISLVLGTLLWPVRPSAAQLCNSGPVALDARATLQLPPSLGIRGVATGPTGRLALWSSGGEVFSINREHSLTRVQLPDSIRPAGIAITPRGLRLVDQTSGGDFLLSPDGQLISMGRVGLGMAEELDQALWQGDGWILGVRDLATRRFVLRRDRPAGKAVLFRSAQSDSVKTVHRYFLSESGRGLLLTRTTAPFTLIRIGPLDGTVDTLAAALSPATGVTIPADSLANWRALPVVALDCTLRPAPAGPLWGRRPGRAGYRTRRPHRPGHSSPRRERGPRRPPHRRARTGLVRLALGPGAQLTYTLNEEATT
jgi:hypothetical protein